MTILKKYACKYAEIIEALEEKGSAFIYGRYNKGAGNIMLGVCMEESAGYERFMETESVFESKSQSKSYCEDVKIKTLKPGFDKRKRYALLTSETLENDNAYNAMMELMNSYENRHGEYLKCVIASRVARDGLNFRNILKIFLTGPDWNPSSMYQAISRGIRAGSHDDLLIEGKIEIKVYEMAAVPDQKILKNLGVDIHIYEVSYLKDVNISHLMRKIIQCTVGCQIQYDKNVRDTDVDYSSQCYYDVCQYQCVDKSPEEMDYSTYNAYYIEEDVKTLTKILVLNIIKMTNGKLFTANDLYKQINPIYTKTCLDLALKYMINHKIQIIDLYGYVSYLYEYNGNYYFSRRYVDDFESALYTEQLICTQNISSEFIKHLDEENYQLFLSKANNIMAYFDILSTDNKIKFLESQFIHPEEKYTELTSQYDKMFFKVHELKLSNKYVKQDISKKSKGRPTKKSEICGKEIKTNNIVYLNMLQLYKETNKHNFIPFYFKANT